jgi:hypothetical protein
MGWKAISADEALRDPVYQTRDLFVGSQGVSWLVRWKMAFGEKADWQNEPDPPAGIIKMSDDMRRANYLRQGSSLAPKTSLGPSPQPASLIRKASTPWRFASAKDRVQLDAEADERPSSAARAQRFEPARNFHQGIAFVHQVPGERLVQFSDEPAREIYGTNAKCATGSDHVAH